jgi:hypothetical protein
MKRKIYHVIFTVEAPEGFDDEFDPYDNGKSIGFDDLFEKQGAEIMNIAIKKEK